MVLTGVFTFDPSQATCDFANDGHMGTEMGVKFADFWTDVTSQEMMMLTSKNGSGSKLFTHIQHQIDGIINHSPTLNPDPAGFPTC